MLIFLVKQPSIFIPGNGLAFFLLNSSALPLLDVIALLLGNISALLGDNITTNLGIGSLLADLSLDWVTLLAIDSFALLTRNILKGKIKFRRDKNKTDKKIRYHLAFLLWNLGALSVIDDATLLGGNILANLILDSATFLLVDDLTLSLSSCGTLLFLNRTALVLISVGTLLVIFGGTFLFVDSLLNGSWHTDTFQLGNVVALLVLEIGMH